jgi:hypothetical protein
MYLPSKYQHLLPHVFTFQTSAPTAASIYLPNIPNPKFVIFSGLPSDYTAVKYSSF